MGDESDKQLNLGNFVFDEKNPEGKSWKFFGRTCHRSLLVSVPIFCHKVNTSICNRSNHSNYM